MREHGEHGEKMEYVRRQRRQNMGQKTEAALAGSLGGPQAGRVAKTVEPPFLSDF